MKIIRRHIKVIAAFLFLNTVNYICFPIVSMALTDGPATPEAFSFEPVDTSDLVNLQTGDFTYNIPLLEVPGPAGGYPISLSYHAGIQPEQEASWVGLGWTLNPGSISRMVSNYPDDWNNLESTVRDFWNGGETNYNSFGLTYGVGNFTSVSASITVANDSYRGVGVGGAMGIGVGMRDGFMSLGVDASVGMAPYGSSISTSAGISLGVSKTVGAVTSSLSLTSDVSSNSKGVSYGLQGGISERDASGKTKSILGASISTSSKSGGMSVAGFSASSSQSNSNKGKMSSYSNSMGISVPLGNGISVRYSRDYVRYWSDEEEGTFNFGSLYNVPADLDENATNDEIRSAYDYRSYDVYDISDYTNSVDEDYLKELDNKGTFLDYDMYNVNAQGVGGSIRPYYYQALLNRRNTKSENDYTVTNVHIDQETGANRPEFRFIGDLSNKLIQSEPEYKSGFFNTSPPNNFSFDANPEFFESFNTSDNGIAIPGSRKIEYITNSEFAELNTNPEAHSFLKTSSTGFTRHSSDEYENLIGGFKITNESGVTYHFSLPVYAYDEHIYTENIDKKMEADEAGNPKGGHVFNHYKKDKRYAYTWLLTAVTGPDFVDRSDDGSPNAQLDENDWGYWVGFDYGMWTDNYTWRTPSKGFKKDLDNNFQTFSTGKKEIYYLDKIQTKTHTAVFVKDTRTDGHGVTRTIPNIVRASSGNFEELDNGGFIPKEVRKECNHIDYLDPEDEDYDPGVPEKLESGFIDYMEFPVALMKLKEIILYDNSNFNDFTKDSNSNSDITHTYNWEVTYDEDCPTSCVDKCKFQDISKYIPHFRDNVYDINDFDDDYLDNSLRSIEFETDNETLVLGTPNSFDLDYSLSKPSTNPENYELLGKLALKRIVNRGKAGDRSIPATIFDYDLDQELYVNCDYYISEDGTGYLQDGHIGEGINFDIVETGSIIRIDEQYLLAVSDGTYYNSLYRRQAIKYIGENILEGGISGSGSIEVTKNPPYNSQAYDIWGFYKSDYDGTNNNNLDRLVTEMSAKNVDVWSLRRIINPLGSETNISYESDSYHTSVYGNSFPLLLKPQSDFNGEVVTFEIDSDISLTQFSSLDLKLFYRFSEDKYIADQGQAVPINTENNLPLYTDDFVVFDLILDANLVDQNGSVVQFDFNGVALDFDKKWADVLQGNLKLNSGLEHKYGGGVRVSSIALNENSLGYTSKTTYSYNKLNQALETDLTSGVTSYEPILMDKVFRDLSVDDQAEVSEALFHSQGLSDLLTYSRFIPGPGVVYEYVTVKESVNQEPLPVKSVNNFQIFNNEFINIPEPVHEKHLSEGQLFSSNESTDEFDYDDYAKSINTLDNFSDAVGSLKRVDLYEIDNNRKVSSTINHYLFQEADQNNFDNSYSNYLDTYFSDLGRIDEVYGNIRIVKHKVEKDLPSEQKIRVAHWYDDLYNAVGKPIGKLLGLTYNVINPEDYPGIEELELNSLVQNISLLRTFPNIMLGQTNIDYRSGITTKSYNVTFDNLSGELTSSISLLPSGKYEYSMNKLAYREFTSMKDKNMLTQSAGNVKWKISDSFKQDNSFLVDENSISKIGLIGANASTWTKNFKRIEPGGYIIDASHDIWIKKSQHIWKGSGMSSGLNDDGTYKLLGSDKFVDFDFNGGGNDGWQKTSEITLYDVYSHALEATDINGNYAATKFDVNQERVFSTAVNANYLNYAYSGSEEGFRIEELYDGYVYSGSGTVSSENRHTGQFSLSVDPDFAGYLFHPEIEESRKYLVSVWTTSDAVEITTVGFDKVDLPTKRAGTGDWYLVSAILTPISGESVYRAGILNIHSASVYMDDFRFQPVDASVSAYAYNEWGELSEVLDNNNLFTRYEYDEMGRLKRVFKETLDHGVVKVSENQINYSQN